MLAESQQKITKYKLQRKITKRMSKLFPKIFIER